MKNSVENLGIACMKNFPKVRIIASDFVEYFLSHKHSLKKKFYGGNVTLINQLFDSFFALSICNWQVSIFFFLVAEVPNAMKYTIVRVFNEVCICHWFCIVNSLPPVGYEQFSLFS